MDQVYVLYISIFLVAFIFYANYNVQIKAVSHMENVFLRKLSNEASTSIYKHQTESYKLDKNIQRISANTKDLKSILHIFDCVKYLKIKVEQRVINDMKTTFNKYLRFNKDISSILRNGSSEFSTTLDDYIAKHIERIPNVNLDIEFFIVDIMYTANKMLCNFQNKTLNEIMEKYDREIFYPNLQTTFAQLSAKNMEYKKQDMEYICSMYNLCRSYPGFTDYLADLIEGILILLPRDKMLIITKIVVKFFNVKIHFFKRIMYEDVLNKTAKKLDNLAKNIFNIKELLNVLRTIIRDKHTFAYNDRESSKNITRSIRILLDIIDKVFDNGGNEMIAINFDNLFNGIKNWSDGDRDDIEKLLALFMNYLVDTLNHNFTHNTRKEIKVLTAVVMERPSCDSFVADYLFTKGSKFVRGIIDSSMLNNEM